MKAFIHSWQLYVVVNLSLTRVLNVTSLNVPLGHSNRFNK